MATTPRPAPDEFEGLITGGTGSESGDRELYARYARTAPRLDLAFIIDRAEVAFNAPGWPELIALHQLHDKLQQQGDDRSYRRDVWDAIAKFRAALVAYTPAQAFEAEVLFWAYARKQSAAWRAGTPGVPVVPLTADEQEAAIQCAHAPDDPPPRRPRRVGGAPSRKRKRT